MSRRGVFFGAFLTLAAAGPGVVMPFPARAQASSPGTATKDVFVDVTAETGVDFTHFNGMSGEFYFLEMMGAGGALLDYDNDGDLDLYLVQGQMLGPGKTLQEAVFPPDSPAPLSDALYRNDLTFDPSGRATVRFTDVSQESGIAANGYGMGAAAGDFDNDGFVDLYVTNYGSNQLWHNNGDGTFRDATLATRSDDNRWSVPAVVFDFDRDGWLDLFIGNYVHFTFSNHKQCLSVSVIRTYCSPAIFSPVADKLLHNGGDGTFTDWTLQSGLAQAFGPALGAVAFDVDADGWLDLYVANDGQANQLWMNRQGRGFSDEALLSGAALNRDGRPEASMGVDAADFDGDGDLDLFMTHLAEETNTLYVNNGDGGFEDATVKMGLGRASFPRTGFGTAWLDFDNDGYQDLVVLNGAVTTIEELYRAGDPHPLHQPNQLFRQRPRGGFEEVTAEAGQAFRVSETSRGALVGDLDNDGDSDLVVTNNAGPARVLLNRLGQDRAWAGLRLLTASGRDALGARVRVAGRDLQPLHRRVATDGSYASSRDPRVLVGLGSMRGRRVRVEVRWLSGQVERWDVRTGRYTTLREGTGTPTR